jgi:hypothetical protein
MAIRFTAELSHYTSAGTYATQVGIDALAALLSPPPAVPAVVPALHQSVFGKNCFLGPKYEICCVTEPRGVVVCTYPTSCPPGFELCRDEGGCIAVLTDPNNCGGCGRKCPAGQGCYDGRCLTILPTGCPVNYTRCDGVCCVPGSTCLNGTCQCPGQAPTAEGCGYGCGTSVATCSPTGQWSFTDPPGAMRQRRGVFQGVDASLRPGHRDLRHKLPMGGILHLLRSFLHRVRPESRAMRRHQHRPQQLRRMWQSMPQRTGLL